MPMTIIIKLNRFIWCFNVLNWISKENVAYFGMMCFDTWQKVKGWRKIIKWYYCSSLPINSLNFVWEGRPRMGLEQFLSPAKWTVYVFHYFCELLKCSWAGLHVQFHVLFCGGNYDQFGKKVCKFQLIAKQINPKYYFPQIWSQHAWGKWSTY